MYTTHTKTIKKLQQQSTDIPRLVISDFDGTLFTPNLNIIPEILHYNRQCTKLLQQQHIPVIINTAKRDWGRKEKHDARLLGIYPDAIIVGAGTKIYHKQADDTWNIDTAWERMLQKFWNTNTIEDVIKKQIRALHVDGVGAKYLLPLKTSDFQVRYRVQHIPTLQLPAMTASLQKEFPSEIKVVYSESVYSNRFGFPTGDILIIPDLAGKDNAVKYLLETYAKKLSKPVEAYCFGDGASDLTSFLSLPSTTKYTLKQFLLHPTKLANHMFQTMPSPKPTLLQKSGTPAIMSVIS